MVNVYEAAVATPELLAALNELLPQLSSSARPVTMDELGEMIASDASRVLVAEHEGAIVGSLTLVVFRIPTGVRAWIEDVVVDGNVRGQGVGDRLNRFALEVAYAAGAKTVDLTSRPTRVAANALYQKLGFVARDTNIYRHDQLR